MQKTLYIPLLAMLTFTLSGCENLPFFGGGEDETASEPAAVQSVPVKPKAQTATQKAAAQAPQKTVVVSQPNVAAGLIASTDPNKREDDIKPRNSDPFSAFPARATIKQAPGGVEAKKAKPTPKRSVPSLPPLPPIERPARFPGLPRFLRPPVPVPAPGGGGSQQAKATEQKVQGRSVPELPNLPPIEKPPSAGSSGRAGGSSGAPGSPNFNPPQLPKAPDPTNAKAVKVTGVIEIRGVPHAIVQAAGQESRYVKAGDYLANGQVLVKRIITNKGGSPVVILEEKGVEVARRVGEGGETAAAPTSSSGGSPEAAPQSTPSPNGASEG
ncbi:hypothetical protein [Oscillatoria sp. FACHB-1406]|uniref:hypothetical protein n=1 Tax=Oscillatoria sp. FACHB-1406 TaxID=2692846 RepID=UPI001683CA90|nr:hypothetical protein [Oscillatoria sp. FACHB-1406]MBD2576416.1 hypothetical protein [Oscillatoria sp. FACHB-1406]